MELKERYKLISNLINHLGGKIEVQGFASNGLQLVGNALHILVNQDRGLIDRQFLAYSQLSESAIVGYQHSQILSAGLHGQHDRTVHQGNILWHVGQILHAVVHRELDVHHIALLPLTVDSDIAGRTSHDAHGLAVHLHAELTWFYPTWIAHHDGYWLFGVG